MPREWESDDDDDEVAWVATAVDRLAARLASRGIGLGQREQQQEQPSARAHALVLPPETAATTGHVLIAKGGGNDDHDSDAHDDSATVIPTRASFPSARRRRRDIATTDWDAEDGGNDDDAPSTNSKFNNKQHQQERDREREWTCFLREAMGRRRRWNWYSLYRASGEALLALERWPTTTERSSLLLLNSSSSSEEDDNAHALDDEPHDTDGVSRDAFQNNNAFAPSGQGPFAGNMPINTRIRRRRRWIRHQRVNSGSGRVRRPLDRLRQARLRHRRLAQWADWNTNPSLDNDGANASSAVPLPIHPGNSYGLNSFGRRWDEVGGPCGVEYTCAIPPCLRDRQYCEPLPLKASSFIRVKMRQPSRQQKKTTMLRSAAVELECVSAFALSPPTTTTTSCAALSADTLLIVLSYLPAEGSTLFAAGRVCRAWFERLQYVPQWEGRLYAALRHSSDTDTALALRTLLIQRIHERVVEHRGLEERTQRRHLLISGSCGGGREVDHTPATLTGGPRHDWRAAGGAHATGTSNHETNAVGGERDKMPNGRRRSADLREGDADNAGEEGHRLGPPTAAAATPSLGPPTNSDPYYHQDDRDAMEDVDGEAMHHGAAPATPRTTSSATSAHNASVTPPSPAAASALSSSTSDDEDDNTSHASDSGSDGFDSGPPDPIAMAFRMARRDTASFVGATRDDLVTIAYVQWHLCDMGNGPMSSGRVRFTAWTLCLLVVCVAATILGAYGIATAPDTIVDTDEEVALVTSIGFGTAILAVVLVVWPFNGRIQHFSHHFRRERLVVLIVLILCSVAVPPVVALLTLRIRELDRLEARPLLDADACQATWPIIPSDGAARMTDSGAQGLRWSNRSGAWRWLLPEAVAVPLLPAVLTRRRGHHTTDTFEFGGAVTHVLLLWRALNPPTPGDNTYSTNNSSDSACANSSMVTVSNSTAAGLAALNATRFAELTNHTPPHRLRLIALEVPSLVPAAGSSNNLSRPLTVDDLLNTENTAIHPWLQAKKHCNLTTTVSNDANASSSPVSNDDASDCASAIIPLPVDSPYFNPFAHAATEDDYRAWFQGDAWGRHRVLLVPLAPTFRQDSGRGWRPEPLRVAYRTGLAIVGGTAAALVVYAAVYLLTFHVLKPSRHDRPWWRSSSSSNSLSSSPFVLFIRRCLYKRFPIALRLSLLLLPLLLGAVVFSGPLMVAIGSLCFRWYPTPACMISQPASAGLVVCGIVMSVLCVSVLKMRHVRWCLSTI